MDVAVNEVDEAVAVICAGCGAEGLPDDLFCESCGAALRSPVSEIGGTDGGADVEGAKVEVAKVEGAKVESREGVATTCADCGAPIAEDGYCSSCGAPGVKLRDHWSEQPVPWVAAVTDKGVRHHRNEDSLALSALPEPGARAVLVVCDGVSSSMDSDVASLAAARAARDVLTTSSEPGPAIAGRIRTWTELLTQAAAAANAEVVKVSRNPTGRAGERQNSPPSCTFVAAVVDGPVIVVGWVGDSRAYWLPDAGPAEQLSIDDSWAAEQVQAGMTREQAESSPQAHAITRWMGVDSPDATPRCAVTTPNGPGWLLVCSDGLWNYCSPAAEVSLLVARTAAAANQDIAATADALVDWANAQGGQDNITVALARLEGAAPR